MEDPSHLAGEKMTVSAPTDSTGGDFAGLAERQEQNRTVLERVRKSADEWQKGLAALFTLAAGLLIIKGRESIEDLETWAQIGAGILLAIGLALAIFGSVKAMHAAFGLPGRRPHFTPGGKRIAERDWDFASAEKARRQLKDARRATYLSLIAFGAAIGLTWYGPEEKSATNLKISTIEKKSFCGERLTSEDGEIVIKRADTEEVARLSFTEIATIDVVDDCSAKADAE